MAGNHEKPDQYWLDDELDTALANFAAVEPREGLESRILASLRASGEEKTAPRSWSWTGAAIVATAIVMVAGIVWRFEKLSRDAVAHQPVMQVQEQPRQGGSNRGLEAPEPVAKFRNKARPNGSEIQSRVVKDHPRLEQFPSPQPLSEQEKILARYVAEYPTHAAEIARARAEALLQDRNEELATNDTVGTR